MVPSVHEHTAGALNLISASACKDASLQGILVKHDLCKNSIFLDLRVTFIFNLRVLKMVFLIQEE